MALLCNVRSTSRINYYTYLFMHLLKHRMKSMAIEVDALDVFTTQLVQEKTNKWDSMKLRNKMITASPLLKPEETYEIRSDFTHVGEIRSIVESVREGIDKNDPGKIMTILENCRNHNTMLFSLVANVLAYFAQTGNVNGIERLQMIYKEANPAVLKVHADFRHYTAEAVWIKGNVPKALSMFEEVYRNHPLLRRNVRGTLRYLFHNAIEKNSEAVTVAISKFTENLANEFKDYSPMVNLWKICFLSEWYSDQVLAFDLLDRHKDLLKYLLPEVTYIVTTALKSHKTDPAYKLLEILLKHNCKTECSLVLIALFDYKFRQRDLYSCSQILQWSTKYNVLLPALYQEKALELLLNVKIKPTRKSAKRKQDYNLKF